MLRTLGIFGFAHLRFRERTKDREGHSVIQCNCSVCSIHRKWRVLFKQLGKVSCDTHGSIITAIGAIALSTWHEWNVWMWAYISEKEMLKWWLLTGIPAILSKYWATDLNIRTGCLKALSFIFECVGIIVNGQLTTEGEYFVFLDYSNTHIFSFSHVMRYDLQRTCLDTYTKRLWGGRGWGGWKRVWGEGRENNTHVHGNKSLPVIECWVRLWLCLHIHSLPQWILFCVECQTPLTLSHVGNGGAPKRLGGLWWIMPAL